MCILFLYVAKEGTSKIKLVVASNRDESYTRPTTPAKFWDTDSNILAGQDCQEGGTWLGINKMGKLAILLNIMSKAPAIKLKSRGDLVTGYLRSSPALRGWTYCNNLHQADIRNQFGLFNFVTVDLLPPQEAQREEAEKQRQTLPESSSPNLKAMFDVTYFSNGSESGPKILSEGESQFFAFGNSVYDSPFGKVTHGCREFEEIVNSHVNSTTAIETGTLKGKLLSFLKSPTRYFPDEQIERQARDAGIKNPGPELTSVFVTMPERMHYGTRTHTILVIDGDDNINYHEWTMEEPINVNNIKWVESEYNFKVSK